MPSDSVPTSKATLQPAVPRPGAERGCHACAVRSLSICGAMPVSGLQRLESIRRDVNIEPRQMLFFEGDAAADLFNVTSGAVKIYKLLADGRRQITGFILPGDFLGLALHNQYTYSAEAVVSTTLCRFPRRALEKLLDEFPALEKRLLQTASNELATAQDQMLLLGRKTASERIATFLLSLGEREERRGARHDVIELPMSRNDIGDYLGLTVETVSRTFTRFRKAGLLALDSAQRVNILDRDELRSLAGIGDDETLAAVAAEF